MGLLFSFAGRIGRGKFWFSSLILLPLLTVLLGVAIYVVDGDSINAWMKVAADAAANPDAPPPADMAPPLSQLGWIILIVGYILILWASLAIMVKRCHDRGQSGWWVLLTLIPLVGFIWWLVNLGILEGEEGPNKYGPDPRAA